MSRGLIPLATVPKVYELSPGYEERTLGGRTRVELQVDRLVLHMVDVQGNESNWHMKGHSDPLVIMSELVVER
jgi:hypothetical protein